jgi:lipopolysaccharide assembly outer membrane protein LptD (OstA)
MLWAQQEVRDGPLIRLRGHVHIATNSVSIEADEADYNPITSSLDPRGHVHISLKNVSPHLKIQENNPEDLPAKFR